MTKVQLRALYREGDLPSGECTWLSAADVGWRTLGSVMRSLVSHSRASIAAARRARSVVAALLLAVAACTEPGPIGQRLLVASEAIITALDATDGRVLGRVQVSRYRDALTLSPDSGTLFFQAFGVFGNAPGARRLFALSTGQLRFEWAEPLDSIAIRGALDSLRVWGDAMAVTPDGRRLLVSGARGTESGLVVLDITSRTPIAFVGPIQVRWSGALASIAVPSPTWPSGLIGALQDRKLFLIDGGSFLIRDSITVADGADFGQILPDPDGIHVYVAGSAFILKYGLFSHEAVASTDRRSQRGRLAISPDGTRLYLTDPGDGTDGPGEGLVRVFDRDLRPLSPISLTDVLGGWIPTTNHSAVSADGERLFVTSGTVEDGLLFPPQTGKVLIVDRRLGRAERIFEIGDWFASEIFVVP